MRVSRGQDGKFLLQKALDETKDQSYVLYAMTQEQLAHTLFPLGGHAQDARRATHRARRQDFGQRAQKPDSQDICFAPDGDYAAAIGRLTGAKERSRRIRLDGRARSRRA